MKKRHQFGYFRCTGSEENLATNARQFGDFWLNFYGAPRYTTPPDDSEIGQITKPEKNRKNEILILHILKQLLKRIFYVTNFLKMFRQIAFLV